MNKDYVFSVMENPPKIVCERIYLRKLDIHDAEDMYSYSCDPDVTKYLTWEPHRNLKTTVSYLKSVKRAYSEHMFYDWAIVLRANGKMVGTCGITSFDFKHDVVEVGYVLNPRYEGYGIMTEALSAVISFCFDTLGAVRAEGRFIPKNLKSRRVLERCGMTYEGIKKDALLCKGELVDLGICSVYKELTQEKLRQ